MGAMKKIVYRVVLIAEDGEYVLRETSSLRSANAFINKEQHNYGDGRRLAIREWEIWT
jgi:hypothetical protein